MNFESILKQINLIHFIFYSLKTTLNLSVFIQRIKWVEDINLHAI